MLQLLRSLVESYEAFRMPKSFMANCVVMTHAVLRQMEMYGGSGNLVLRKKKGGRKPKAKKPKAGEGGEGGEGAGEGGEGAGEGADGGAGAGEGADGGEGAEAASAWQEEAFDFERNLHDFVAHRAVLEKYAQAG